MGPAPSLAPALRAGHASQLGRVWLEGPWRAPQVSVGTVWTPYLPIPYRISLLRNTGQKVAKRSFECKPCLCLDIGAKGDIGAPVERRSRKPHLEGEGHLSGPYHTGSLVALVTLQKDGAVMLTGIQVPLDQVQLSQLQHHLGRQGQ